MTSPKSDKNKKSEAEKENSAEDKAAEFSVPASGMGVPKSGSITVDSGSEKSIDIDDDTLIGENQPKAHEQHASRWPLEADRLAIHQPLLESLRIIAGHYGRRTSITGLLAGLPIPKEGLTPGLFIRAASRASLQARMIERSLESITIVPNLPCILVLEGNQACILHEVIKGKGRAKPKLKVTFPETRDDIQELAFKDIEKIYTGHAFYIRPIARMDDRAGPAEVDTKRSWFWGVLWRNKRVYGEVVLAAVIVNLLALASPLFIMNVYDRVIPNNALDTLWVLAIGVVVAFSFDFLLRNLRAIFLDVTGKESDIKISAQLFEQIMGMKMSERPASAGILSAHMREFESLRDFFTSATLTTLIDLPFVFLFIILIFIIGGAVGFVPLIMIPVVLGIGWLLQKPMHMVIKESMNESAMKNALVFETISGLETIKVQAAEGHTQRKWEELTEKASKTAVRLRKVSAFAMNFTMFSQQITSILVVILGAHLIAAGDITMGALIACVILTGRCMGPLGQVAGLLTRINQSREALSQLDELMKKDVERPAGRHFVTKPVVEGQVAFKDVTFHYPGQSAAALKNMSFAVEPGEHIGIIGAVGCGKTTLMRLMLNLYEPDSGSVQLDNTDVRQIDPGDLRRNIGSVQQSPHLFFGSVRENITLGHETAPERAVLRAAELAGVMEFLRDSETGLDSQVGERGEALSGGQRQAVAIARALLYDPPVLILDEPTAAMDPASENRLKKRLVNVMEDRTTLLITHKGSMLNLVSKLILLDKGKLVAYGPKDDVIRRLQARQFGTAAEQDNV